MASGNWRGLSVKRNRHLVSATRAGDSLSESLGSHCFLFSLLFCSSFFLVPFLQAFFTTRPATTPSWTTTLNPSNTTKTTSSLQDMGRHMRLMMIQTMAWCTTSSCSSNRTRLCSLPCLVGSTCFPATLRAALISDPCFCRIPYRPIIRERNAAGHVLPA